MTDHLVIRLTRESVIAIWINIIKKNVSHGLS